MCLKLVARIKEPTIDKKKLDKLWCLSQETKQAKFLLCSLNLCVARATRWSHETPARAPAPSGPTLSPPTVGSVLTSQE
jgi:hypothetical protein